MQDKILMMVRDRGHALTIDIDTSTQNNILVKYFIPKLCNLDMIKTLPGINKSSITEYGARGAFLTSKEKLTEELFNFVEKVPTDDDLPSQPFKIEEVKEIIMEENPKGIRMEKLINVKNILEKHIEEPENKRNKEGEDLEKNIE